MTLAAAFDELAGGDLSGESSRSGRTASGELTQHSPPTTLTVQFIPDPLG
jgi:hypothetical protein